MSEFKSINNKFLTVRKTVILTERIDSVIFALDNYFRNFPVEVSSGQRTPEKQLFIIMDYAKKIGVELTFSDDDLDTKDDNNNYLWQWAWSKVLDAGYLVNPPREAKCLGVYKYGQYIQPSSHLTPCRAFDIDPKSSIDTVVSCLKDSIVHDVPVRSYTIERSNNCVHVNV